MSTPLHHFVAQWTSYNDILIVQDNAVGWRRIQGDGEDKEDFDSVFLSSIPNENELGEAIHYPSSSRWDSCCINAALRHTTNAKLSCRYYYCSDEEGHNPSPRQTVPPRRPQRRLSLNSSETTDFGEKDEDLDVHETLPSLSISTQKRSPPPRVNSQQNLSPKIMSATTA
jgi:hypothetical protein